MKNAEDISIQTASVIVYCVITKGRRVSNNVMIYYNLCMLIVWHQHQRLSRLSYIHTQRLLAMDVISAYVYRVTFGHVNSIADYALPSGVRSSTSMLLAVLNPLKTIMPILRWVILCTVIHNNTTCVKSNWCRHEYISNFLRNKLGPHNVKIG